MSNSLPVLIPVIIASLQRVLRQTGHVLNLGTVDAQATAAAVGQTVNLPGTAALSVVDVTPGVVPPAAVDTTPTAETLTLTRHKGARFHLTAEEWLAIGARGPEFRSRMVDEAIAAIVNDAAAYFAGVVNAGCGRAIGAQGSNPFATDASIVVDADKLLNDALCPISGRVAAFNTTDWAGIKKLPSFMKLNEAPLGVNFAAGLLGQLGGFSTGFDQSLAAGHVTSDAAGYVTNGAAAIGDTTITVDTGTGTWVPGDVIHATGDTANKYVVKSATATVITLNAPLVAPIADGVVIVKQASHRINLVAGQDAAVLALRPSAQLPEGDSAAMATIVADPVTGVAMRLAMYRGYHLNQWELSMVSGATMRRRTLACKVIG